MSHASALHLHLILSKIPGPVETLTKHTLPILCWDTLLLQFEAWSVPTYHEELDVEANFEDLGG